MKSLSWKTTLCGVLGIVGLGITQVFDGYPLVFKIGAFLAGIAGPLGLLFARDNDKSSEQVGAVPVAVIGDPPPAPRSSLIPVLLVVGSLCLAAGCASGNPSGRLLATTVQTVDSAMVGWSDWVALGNASTNAEARVRVVYTKYQQAEAVAEAAYLYAAKSGDRSAWDRAAAAMVAARDALISLVGQLSPKVKSP